ncbi:hypothetical protein [Mycolicibacterium setense]|uniref:hypothetical protein n=1 Tax=Mycolicibacterium setense TaxID=431269 RepID=UPI001F334853|nr:hypothetical protein [Mycolicibacterium setense]
MVSAMKFETTHVFREHWFSLGIESTTGCFFLSIPVSVRIADYTEYYQISEACYRSFSDDPRSAIPFADQCRRQEHDDLLFIPPPPTNRGTAI